jgi:predicted methyltransferase
MSDKINVQIVVSAFQVGEIIEAKDKGRKETDVSLDLGRTLSRVSFDANAVIFPDGQRIELRILEKVLGESTCVTVEGNELLKIHFFLPETGRFYRLVATGADTPPTAEISGVRMHRTKDTDPMRDTLSKIAAVSPISGSVLDTCTGLGYTAIYALKAGAREVVTVEEDEGMVALAEVNPWSRELSDRRIRKVRGDVFEEVKNFGEGAFSTVIHDPPRLALAGELYSEKFYRQLYRVLVKGGRLFHYVGAPGSLFRGKDAPSGVLNRLASVGFEDVKKNPESLGVVARKQV